MDMILKPLPAMICLLYAVVGVFSLHYVGASTITKSGYQLTTSPTRVIAGFTQDVSLRCKKDPSRSSRLEKIERIRILKQTADRWWQVARINDYDGEVEADNQVKSAGWMDNSKAEAFLEITWTTATLDTFGTYKCEVVGLNKSFLHEEEETPEVTILEQQATSADVFNFINNMKIELKAKVIENAESRKEIEEEMNKKMDFVAKDNLVAWPSGQYGLLQPRSGCPVDLAFYGGDTGYVRFEVDPIDDDYSQFHFAGPMLGKTSKPAWFSLHFCVVTRVFNSGSWPDGAYCIHQKGGACPDTFNSTRLDGDIGILGNETTFGGTVPDILPYQLCCKDSAPSDQPIVLPTETPFYLYRAGSSCQEVKDMDVTQENLTLQPSETHVPFTLDLCYYEKQNSTEGR